ncbi:MAG: hydroxyisourate hydrolase [Pyrinomonadaceae bacterium]
MSSITTHIVDSRSGKAGAGIVVGLQRKTHTSGWQVIGERLSNVDGRVNDLLPDQEPLLMGHYRLTFEIGLFYLQQDIECLFPQISINFVVKDPLEHYHIPLVISPFGYSTYRGG